MTPKGERNSEYYNLSKYYSTMEFDGYMKLIAKTQIDEDRIKYYAFCEEFYLIINEAHLSWGDVCKL